MLDKFDYMILYEMASEKEAIDYIEEIEIDGHLIMIECLTLSGYYNTINFNINQYQNKENEKNKKDKIKTEEDLVKEKFTSSRERIEEYKRIYSNQRISTNYLHKLVSCYHLLEERKLLENVDLFINTDTASALNITISADLKDKAELVTTQKAN